MSRPEFLKIPERAAYYDAADSWATDLSRSEARVSRVAWVVAAGASLIAILEAAALLAMIPLKTDVPYVVTVDRQTGYTEVAQKLTPGGTLAERDAVIQSALVQYVLARETFDAADLAEQYRKVQLWSDSSAARAYIAAMARANPDSPLNTYPGNVTLKVGVKGVTLIDRDTAIVRFDARRIDPAGVEAPIQSYAATIGFRFSGEPMTMAQRFINPLGFQVTHYRRDAEQAASTDGGR